MMPSDPCKVLTCIGFTHDWVNELVRILKVPVDYAEETTHESLARNTILQACLSIMNALGFRGEGEPRSFMSKFAMVELNVRNIAILITLASNTPNAVKDRLTPLDEHGTCILHFLTEWLTLF